MTASSLAGSTVTNTMTYTYFGDGTRVGARVSNHDAAGYSGMRYGISSDESCSFISIMICQNCGITVLTFHFLSLNYLCIPPLLRPSTLVLFQKVCL